jgi:predicted dienelactone hydrolase
MAYWCGIFLLAASAAAYAAKPVVYEVESADAAWKDQKRDREVLVRIHAPQLKYKGPFPLIVFSHGFGESRNTYANFGRYWVSHGYITIVVNHSG